MKRKSSPPKYIILPAKISNRPAYQGMVKGTIHEVMKTDKWGFWVNNWEGKLVRVFNWECHPWRPVKMVRGASFRMVRGG